MKLKNVLPIIAMLLVVFLAGCEKDMDTNMSLSENSGILKSQQVVLEIVNLGIAGDFAVLSKAGITDVYKSSITGDVGSSPITGAAILLSCSEVSGTIYSVDAAGPSCIVTNPSRLTTAVSDMEAAYTDAAGRANPDFLNLGAGSIGGQTLSPGLYKWTTSLLIPTDITISGGPTDVWIFQVSGSLTMNDAVKINLTGGAQSKNIFWQITSAVTLGTTSHFEGNILGQTSVSMLTGASINGRILAHTAVSLQMNTVSLIPDNVPETILPTINSTDPLNNAVSIANNSTVSVTFSEEMNPSTINVSSFTLMQDANIVSGVVTYNGTTATFTPASNLEYNKIYTVIISTESKDLAGNALASNFTFSFTTVDAPDVILPTVISTIPADNASNIELNNTIEFTFSEVMNPLTINPSTLTLMQGSTVVSGIVTYSGMTAIFKPTGGLTSGIEYTATITTGAKDLAGNALAANNVFNFTTIEATPTSSLETVNLGIAGNFTILSKTGITDVYKSAITGDVGSSPITGSAIHLSCEEVVGTIYSVDVNTLLPCAVTNASMLTTAVSDMEAAYTDAAGRANPDFTEFGAGNIGGKTLIPGLYKWSSGVIIPTDVTISGGPNDVWIFQVAGNITMSAAMNITLIGGAQAKNIFWVTAGSVTIGTTSHFEGNILGQTGISLLTGASINGRLLAQTAVTLQMNTVVMPQ